MRWNFFYGDEIFTGEIKLFSSEMKHFEEDKNIQVKWKFFQRDENFLWVDENILRR